jgi:hypothetical protein
MAFEGLNDRLRLVAERSITLCRSNWGGHGLTKEQPIDPKIGWQPTFYMKPSRVLMVAVEVSDRLFPEILKIAAHDIERYDFPISVYQACSLRIYQKDPRFARVKQLREHGFGIITVDDDGSALIQVRAEPLAQYITTETLDKELSTLTPRLKVKFKSAYATYLTNTGQGLQEVGQIVEALVKRICMQAESANHVPSNTSKNDTASMIDTLYQTPRFQNHRAALGGARSFVKTYRNTASHPAVTAKQAATKIRKCRAGFLEAIRIADELRSVSQSLGYRIIIH